MELAEINQKKLRGDYVVAGRILGISNENVRQALNRPKSKYHASSIEAISKVIQSREALINN